jgi:Pentacotripeptide-repeat region of PRORP/PPR repeat
VQFPEGVCLNILSTAARHANPQLATSVIEVLTKQNVPPRSFHFLPLIEAYVRAGEYYQAFVVMGLMRSSCPETPPEVRQFRYLINELSQSAKSVDQAFFALQDIVKQHKQVDVVAFNVVMEACLKLGDLTRALSNYKEVGNLGVKPNSDTINALLALARSFSNIDVARFLLSEMNELGIKPNHMAYQNLILTYMQHRGQDYEQAFVYLEEMKAQGYVPSQGTYYSMARKCVVSNDKRAVKLLEEADALGYDMKKSWDQLRQFASLGASQKRVGERQQAFTEARRKEAEEARELAAGYLDGEDV